ncbi:MAG: zinc ribbon domain-containing protein [Firmicutes bacterium]|nr:zinc ribbon domain-containing protein [Bacillota bacterium]
MALFDKALKKGLSDALGKAASNLTQQLNQSQNQMNQQNYNQGYQQQNYQQQNYQRQPNPQAQQAVNQFASNLETMFSGLTKSVQNYATEMSKNLKMCPNCGKPCSADIKFCDSCGTELPEETLSQGAVCPSCGKQNPLGTKFCQDCGTKLPHAVQEEQRAQAKDAEVMAKWDQALSVFPKWNCGGTGFDLEEMNDGILFRISFPNYNEARVAVDRYRELLNQNGYQPAGQYPSYEHLYRMIGTTCYHVDLEHCFESDADTPNIYFSVGEPQGGFNYVKPQPNIGGFNFKKLF